MLVVNKENCVIILLSLCDNLAVFVFSLVNFINPPSKLDNGSDYMLFKVR